MLKGKLRKDLSKVHNCGLFNSSKANLSVKLFLGGIETQQGKPINTETKKLKRLWCQNVVWYLSEPSLLMEIIIP